MLRVRITLNADRMELRATGHASGKPGENIACAAGTVLIRTAARWLSSRSDVTIGGSAPHEGELRFHASLRRNGPEAETSSGVISNLVEYLAQGFRDLEQEYPADVRLELLQGTDP